MQFDLYTCSSFPGLYMGFHGNQSCWTIFLYPKNAVTLSCYYVGFNCCKDTSPWVYFYDHLLYQISRQESGNKRLDERASSWVIRRVSFWVRRLYNRMILFRM